MRGFLLVRGSKIHLTLIVGTTWCTVPMTLPQYRSVAMMVSFKCQLEATQNHLGKESNEGLSRSDWFVGISVKRLSHLT